MRCVVVCAISFLFVASAYVRPPPVFYDDVLDFVSDAQSVEVDNHYDYDFYDYDDNHREEKRTDTGGGGVTMRQLHPAKWPCKTGRTDHPYHPIVYCEPLPNQDVSFDVRDVDASNKWCERHHCRRENKTVLKFKKTGDKCYQPHSHVVPKECLCFESVLHHQEYLYDD